MSGWDSTCITGKRSYRDRAEAHQALNAVRRRHKNRTERTAYRCRHCGDWHLASSTPQTKKPERSC